MRPAKRRPPSRAASLGLQLLILLISFALRVHRLGDQNVWWDEGWSVSFARQPAADLLRRSAGDVHPPGYYLLLHLWRSASGDGEFGLRYLSAAAGVLAVAATYLLGRAVGGARAGLLAAFFLGVSRFHIWWSQEMRMYALASLFSALVIWAALRLWDRGRKVDWLAYVAFTAAGLYTLYLSALVVVVINLVWLWVLWRAVPRRPVLWRWLSAQAVVVLLFAPWLVYALQHVPTWSSASSLEPRLFPEIYWTFLATGISADVESYRWLTLPLLAVFLVALLALFWRSWRHLRAGRSVVLLLSLVLFPAGLVYLGSLPRAGFLYAPQLSPRYLLIIVPAFATLLGWGLACLWRRQCRPMGALSTLVVVVAAGISLSGYFPGRVLADDYRSLASTLTAYVQPGDLVVLDNDQDWPIFAYYYPGMWVGIPNQQPIDADSAEALLSPLWASHQGIWLVLTPYAAMQDRAGDLPGWLSSQAAAATQFRFDDKVVRFYARTASRAATLGVLVPAFRPSQPLAAEMSSGLSLVGYDQAIREVHPGDVVHLLLLWAAAEPARSQGNGGIALSLVDCDGRQLTHLPMPWPLESGRSYRVLQQVDLPLPPESPPGVYRLFLQTPEEGRVAPLGKIRLLPLSYTPASLDQLSIDHPLDATFAGDIRLLGYDTGADTLRPGDALDLTLYWQAQRLVERRYKVFVHLLGQEYNPGSGNFLWGQQDNEPVLGARPTTSWQVGEAIVDNYSISLEAGAPPGEYGIEVGLYDPATGERLQVQSAGNTTADHLILAHLTVGGP